RCGGARSNRELDRATTLECRLHEHAQPGAALRRACAVLTTGLCAADPFRICERARHAEQVGSGAGRRKGRVSFGATSAACLGAVGVTTAERFQRTRIAGMTLKCSVGAERIQ